MKRTCETCGAKVKHACECDLYDAVRQVARAEQAFGMPGGFPSLDRVLGGGGDPYTLAHFLAGHPYWPSVVLVASAHQRELEGPNECRLRDRCVAVLRVKDWLRASGYPSI